MQRKTNDTEIAEEFKTHQQVSECQNQRQLALTKPQLW